MQNTRNALVVIISALLYAASLALPAFNCPSPSVGFYGYETLAYGWVGLIYLDIRWYVNLIYAWLILSILMPKKVKKAPSWIIFSALFLAVLSIPLPSAGCSSSGGAAVFSESLSSGGFLWVAALCIAMSYSLLMAPQAQKR